MLEARKIGDVFVNDVTLFPFSYSHNYRLVNLKQFENMSFLIKKWVKSATDKKNQNKICRQ